MTEDFCCSFLLSARRGHCGEAAHSAHLSAPSSVVCFGFLFVRPILLRLPRCIVFVLRYTCFEFSTITGSVHLARAIRKKIRLHFRNVRCNAVKLFQFPQSCSRKFHERLLVHYTYVASADLHFNCCASGIGFNVTNSKPTASLNELIAKENVTRSLPLLPFTVEGFIARTLTELEVLLRSFSQYGPGEFLSIYLKYWLHL